MREVIVAHLIKYWLFITFVLFSTSALSEFWLSPIDLKYKEKNYDLYIDFTTAREIIDSYRGQRAKLEKAYNILSNILEQDDEFAPAYREFGRLYILFGYKHHVEGEKNPSEEVILKSIEIEPEYADSYVLLGHLYTLMKRNDEAKTALEKAEEIGTEIPWLQLNWADLHYRNQNYIESLKRYEYMYLKGTSNRKAYGNTLDGLIKVYYQLDKTEKSIEIHEEKIKFEPESAWSWANYASFILYTVGDADGAIEKASKALEIMEFGMAKQVLATAYYYKWNELKGTPATKADADLYFFKAKEIYPNKMTIVNEAYKFDTTVKLAQALELAPDY